MQVGYSLHGHLNAAHDNAVLLLPPTSGGRHSYDALIGPGKPFDTDRFLIITVDPIGGGASSNPADGLGAHFPPYTIRDMVAAEARLIHDVLKIEHLHAVAGASMGSFQALEWAVHQPIPIDRLVLVAPAARSDAHFRAITDGMEAVLGGNDPHRSAAARLRAAAALFMPWLRSDAYLVRQGEASNRAEVEALARSWTRNWDPISLLYRYRASAVHDVGVPFGNDVKAALARVNARTLVVDISSDRTVLVSDRGIAEETSKCAGGEGRDRLWSLSVPGASRQQGVECNLETRSRVSGSGRKMMPWSISPTMGRCWRPRAFATF
jgi:homoserine O-acetyltransferase